MELALAGSPLTIRSGPSLAILCSELTVGSPLDVGKRSQRRQWPTPSTMGTMPPSFGLSTTSPSRLRCPPSSTRQWPGPLTFLPAPNGSATLPALHRCRRRRFTAACAGDIEEMDRCFEIKGPLVDRLDQPFLSWVHTLQRATRALIAGDTEEAESWATQALTIGTEGGQPDAAVIFGAQFIMVSLGGGRWLIDPLILQAITDNPGLPVFRRRPDSRPFRGGPFRRGAPAVGRLRPCGFELPLDPTWLTGMIAYADAAIECGDPSSPNRCSPAGSVFRPVAVHGRGHLRTDKSIAG